MCIRDRPNTQVTMDILLAGMKNKILDSAVMSVPIQDPNYEKTTLSDFSVFLF